MGYDIATELSVKVLAKMRQERDSRDVPKITSPVYQPIARLWDQETDHGAALAEGDDARSA